MKFLVKGFDAERPWTEEEFVVKYKGIQLTLSDQERSWVIVISKEQVEELLRGFTSEKT